MITAVLFQFKRSSFQPEYEKGRKKERKIGREGGKGGRESRRRCAKMDER